MLFKLSNLNSNLALTLGYLNPALNNSALEKEVSLLRSLGSRKEKASASPPPPPPTPPSSSSSSSSSSSFSVHYSQYFWVRLFAWLDEGVSHYSGGRKGRRIFKKYVKSLETRKFRLLFPNRKVPVIEEVDNLPARIYFPFEHQLFIYPLL